MNGNEVKPGLRVKITKLVTTKGMLVHQKHLDARKLGMTGEIQQYVAGHGGDVWVVRCKA